MTARQLRLAARAICRPQDRVLLAPDLTRPPGGHVPPVPVGGLLRH